MIAEQLEGFLERTNADELIVATKVFGREERFRSFEILREVAAEVGATSLR